MDAGHTRVARFGLGQRSGRRSRGGSHEHRPGDPAGASAPDDVRRLPDAWQRHGCGEPGVVFTSGGAVIHVVSLRIEGGARAVSMTLNPDKLSRWSVEEVE